MSLVNNNDTDTDNDNDTTRLNQLNNSYYIFQYTGYNCNINISILLSYLFQIIISLAIYFSIGLGLVCINHFMSFYFLIMI